MDVVLSQPSHIFIFKFSAKSMLLTKHRVVANVTRTPTFMITSLSTLYHKTLIEISKIMDHFALRNEHPATCEVEYDTDLS